MAHERLDRLRRQIREQLPIPMYRILAAFEEECRATALQNATVAEVNYWTERVGLPVSGTFGAGGMNLQDGDYGPI